MYFVSYDTLFDVLPDGEELFVSDRRRFVILDEARAVAQQYITDGINASLWSENTDGTADELPL